MPLTCGQCGATIRGQVEPIPRQRLFEARIAASCRSVVHLRAQKEIGAWLKDLRIVNAEVFEVVPVREILDAAVELQMLVELQIGRASCRERVLVQV